MSSTDRPQRSATRATARKSSMNPAPETSLRDTQYSDEYLAAEEQDPSNPPRGHSSVIRINPPHTTTQQRRVQRPDTNETPTTRRSSSPQNIPQRSTQKNYPGQAAPVAPVRSRNVTTNYETPAPVKRERRNIHWLLYVGLGMLIALILWIAGMNVLTWGTNEYNNIVYGNPRTFQTDAVVGHNDSSANPSHFIALNLHGQIIVIEFPGGNPAKALDYAGPDLISPGEDLLPVTLEFSDVNHDGKVDMIVHVAEKQFVFYNNGTSFATSNNSSNPAVTPTVTK